MRPVRWTQGVPSPVHRPQDCDVVIFRENTEDVYCGIEWQSGSAEAGQLIAYLRDTSMSLEDIAYRLRFSDAANFRHAFKRWTGKSPGEYRGR